MNEQLPENLHLSNAIVLASSDFKETIHYVIYEGDGVLKDLSKDFLLSLHVFDG